VRFDLDLFASPAGLTRGSILFGKKMDCRVISAFTRVFHALCPAMTVDELQRNVRVKITDGLLDEAIGTALCSPDAWRQPSHDCPVVIFAASTNGVRLNNSRRKSRRLLQSKTFLARKRHPFADDSAPYVVIRSHRDFLYVCAVCCSCGQPRSFAHKKTVLHEDVTHRSYTREGI
jgi:hypothetical protein